MIDLSYYLEIYYNTIVIIYDEDWETKKCKTLKHVTFILVFTNYLE